MKLKKISSFLSSAIVLAVSVLFIQSCEKTPVPSFTFEPAVNPEAGDSIYFINATLDATTYIWNFGDGSSSSDQHPSNIYIEAGNYDVILTATNEKKSALITETVTINAPTVLGFFVYEDDETTVMPDVSVWVYDNEYDWENSNDPQYSSYTDSDGFAMYLNLEAQEYIVDLYKETATGYWGAAFSIAALTLNEINLYGLTMTYYEDSSKKGVARNTENRTPLLPAVKISE